MHMVSFLLSYLRNLFFFLKNYNDLNAAITNRSFCTAMVGRALVGLGSAETVSRVIIASTVPKQYVSLLSGVFVAAGALGKLICSKKDAKCCLV